MNWQAGEGHIQRNTLEKAWWNTTTDYCKLLSDSFQNEEKRHGTMRWQSVEDKRKKKEKEKREEKKKKERSEERWQQYTLFPFLFLSSSFPYSLLFLDLPFLSLCRRDRKGKERESGEREERKRERKGKEREFIAVIFPCSPSFYFLFSLLSFSFFPLFALFSLADATGVMSYVVFQT